MSELRIHGAGNHLSVDGLKLVHPIAESNDLSRADECAAGEIKRNIYLPVCHPSKTVGLCNMPFKSYVQVQRIEEENKIFSLKVRQPKFLEFSVNDSSSFPVGCRL